MKAYENLIPEGTTPSYFLYIDVDPASIDVNIHPTKAEIKFEEDQLLFQTVFAAVKEAMGRSSIAGNIDFDNPEAREMPVIGTSFREYTPSSTPTVGLDPDYDPFMEMPSQAGHDAYGAGHDMPYSSHVEKSQNYGALFENRTLPTQQILVVQGKYILTQSATGLMAVHVRRARERLFFDRFLKALTAEAHVSQQALFPVTVTVGVEGRLTIDAHSETLRKLGFDIAPFGPDSVVVNGVPEGYSAEPGKAEEMVGNLLLILSDDSASLPGVMEQAMAGKFAILGASGSEKLTSPLEAQRLVDALLQSDNPEYTPSGKKIISIVALEELEKKFQ